MQVQEENKEVDWSNYSFELEDFVFSNSIILPDESPIDLFLTLIPRNDNARSEETWYDFTISSLRGDVDIRHCHGKAAVLESKYRILELLMTQAHHSQPTAKTGRPRAEPRGITCLSKYR